MPGFPQADTDPGYTSTIALLDGLIPRVSSEIDGYCARRYTVPLNGATVATDAVPPLIRTIAIDMTTHRAYRVLYANDSVNRDTWLDAFNTAEQTLEKIRDGQLDVSDTSGAVLPERGASKKVTSNTLDYTPTFGEDTSTSWVTDPDKLDDLGSERS